MRVLPLDSPRNTQKNLKKRPNARQAGQAADVRMPTARNFSEANAQYSYFYVESGTDDQSKAVSGGKGAVDGEWLVVQGSAFRVQRSGFIVQGSWFADAEPNLEP